MSLFISFEGGEGSGKSTQAAILLKQLQQNKVNSMLVHEPGSTPLGDFLRTKLKTQVDGEHSLTPRTELFLFSASRTELIAKKIKPALQNQDTVVIADRFSDSTVAYQSYGRKIPLEDVVKINRVATLGICPDLTFLLDCSPKKSLERLSPQFMLDLDQNNPRIDLAGTRRFEEESIDFHNRVRAGYKKMAKQEPSRWVVLDANNPVEDISNSIWEHVQDRLKNI